MYVPKKFKNVILLRTLLISVALFLISRWCKLYWEVCQNLHSTAGTLCLDFFISFTFFLWHLLLFCLVELALVFPFVLLVSLQATPPGINCNDSQTQKSTQEGTQAWPKSKHLLLREPWQQSYLKGHCIQFLHTLILQWKLFHFSLTFYMCFLVSIFHRWSC